MNNFTLGSLPMFLFKSRRQVLQVILLVTISLFSELFIELDVAHAVCIHDNIEYPTGKRIRSGGETLECQSDGKWKKVSQR